MAEKNQTAYTAGAAKKRPASAWFELLYTNRLQKKDSHRLITIASLGLSKLAPPAFTVIISLLVVRLYSQELWGEFVGVTLIVNLTVAVIGWGNQDYLIKTFSLNPSRIGAEWSQNLTSRFIIYAACVPVIAFVIPQPVEQKVLILLWILLLYGYRAFDSLIFFNRDFRFLVVLEVATNIVLIAGIVLTPDLTVARLIFFYCITTMVKVIAAVIFYREDVIEKFTFWFSLESLRNSFPFFLPSLIGFVQGRIDMYVVAFSLQQVALAKYQIFISLLSLIHQVALLSITPYTKNIYRLANATIEKFSWKFFLSGCVVSVFAMPVLYGVIRYHYLVDLPLIIYAVGIFTLIPLFYYSIKTYQWFKAGKQYNVVVVNLIMAVVTLGFSMALIPMLGITGAIIANCIGQWTAFIIFLIIKIKK